jgi:hypothetical protein
MIVHREVVTIVMQYGKFSQFILQLKNHSLSKDAEQSFANIDGFSVNSDNSEFVRLSPSVVFAIMPSKFLQTQEES